MSSLRPGDVAYLGIACDHNSSFMRGASEGPARVRQVLHNGASGLGAENGDPVVDDPRFVDLGDVVVAENEADYLGIAAHVQKIVAADARPLIVGGDHSITYPVLEAVRARYGPLTIVHFDAHADLYDQFDDNRYSHACPFARIMEAEPRHRLIQIGVRSVNAHLIEQTRRFNVTSIAARDVQPSLTIELGDGPIYLTFDLDALDPAFAPGVSHHEPGGLSVREALTIIQNLRGTLVGADIVEFNPRRDLNDMTAMVAAKLVREIGHKLLP